MAKQLVDPPVAGERRLTMGYEEFLAWWGEDTRGEWVDGEVVVFMPPRLVHQELVLFLSVLLSWYVRRCDLGRVIVAPFEMLLLDGRASRQPDILFVGRNHLGRLTDERLDGPADLVVEVVSDDSTTRDRRDKRREYEEAGVPEYWIFDPRPGRRRAEFYRLGDDDRYVAAALDDAGRYRSAVLPGFWLDPAWLRQDPLPDPDDLRAIIAPTA